MSDRFPPLRPQGNMTRTTRPGSRALPAPAPVDLTLFAAMAFFVAMALI